MADLKEGRGNEDGLGKNGLIIICAALILLVVVYAGNRLGEERAKLSAKKASLGTASFKKRDYSQAVTYLREAVRLDPNNAAAAKALGRSHEALEQPDAAAKAYSDSVAADPKQPEVLTRLALIHWDQGKRAEAMKDIKQALAVDNNAVAPQILLIQIYKQTGEFDKAIGVFDRLIKAGPPGVDMAGLYVEKGVVYVQKKDFAAARKAWKKALEIDPKNLKALNLLDVFKSR